MSATAEAGIALAEDRGLGFVELAKPRLNLLVLATALAGYVVGGREGIAPLALGVMLLGTALVATGASALNQWMEREVDGRMRRTRGRPLPSGRIRPRHALLAGAVAVAAGVATLALWVNPLTASLGAFTCASYLALYTPLKKITPLNTLVGAIPGAVPPVMGWTAARGALTPEAWVLFGILFLWQIPHFLAIAWLYREDYRAAGLRMMPLVALGARRTGQLAVLHALALVPVAILPALLGLAGSVYLVVAVVGSLAYLAAAIDLALRCGEATARRLFRVSLVLLPVLFLLMALDRVPA